MGELIPTIREIAKACGYNNSTVSRALSNKASIPAETRDRILATAKSMGWKPNPLASAYMAHYRSTRTPKFQATLAFVISFPETKRFADLPDFFKVSYEGAKRRAVSLGFTLETIWLRDVDFDFRKLKRLLRNRGIPGLVVHGGKLPEDAFCALDLEPFAAATWGYSVMKPQLHRAAYHWNQGIRMALQKLRASGYRRIALAISTTLDSLTDHSLAGAFCYEEKFGFHSEVLMSLIFGGSGAEAGAQIRAWLKKNKPDVVIGTHEVRQTIEEMGWKIPGDIGYASPHWSALWPDIGGIDQMLDVVGANAVDLVSAQLLRNERGVPASPKLLLNEGRWVDAKSIPPRELRSATPPLVWNPHAGVL